MRSIRTRRDYAVHPIDFQSSNWQMHVTPSYVTMTDLRVFLKLPA